MQVLGLKYSSTWFSNDVSFQIGTLSLSNRVFFVYLLVCSVFRFFCMYKSCEHTEQTRQKVCHLYNSLQSSALKMSVFLYGANLPEYSILTTEGTFIFTLDVILILENYINWVIMYIRCKCPKVLMLLRLNL